MQRQARRSLVVAGAFTVAAATAAAVPHSSGAWLPLHLFLVGGLLSAVSGVTQLLAVTWSAAPAPAARAAALQRWLLALGAASLAFSREVGLPPAVTVAAASVVIAALVLLAGLLVQVRTRAVVDRFSGVIDAYLVAILLGVAGSISGALVAAGAAPALEGLRTTHLTTNLLGLVGLVIAGTVPYFTATQARTKTSRRANSATVRALALFLAIAVAVTGAGELLQNRVATGIGLGSYAVGIVTLAVLLPPLGRRQFRWAGPRLAQLLAGLLWWAATTVSLSIAALRGASSPRNVVLALVVGGYAQILAASVAYLGPVLRGGGAGSLTAGFAVTRSWFGLAAGNAAALAALTGRHVALVALLAVWAIDVAVRVALLAYNARDAIRP